jgi:hypothetical protein
MTSIEKPNGNLYEPVLCPSEGFRIENAASVAIENCLNGGVHLKRLWGLLWGVPAWKGLSCLVRDCCVILNLQAVTLSSKSQQSA